MSYNAFQTVLLRELLQCILLIVSVALSSRDYDVYMLLEEEVVHRQQDLQ